MTMVLEMKNEVKFMARTVEGLRRLAAWTAGAMEEKDMVVKIRTQHDSDEPAR